MTFPATKRLWGFLWRVPDGWEDLGRYFSPKPDDPRMHAEWFFGDYCTRCGYAHHLGRESDGVLFIFCPRCLTKLAETR
jgi:hypothetical protein